MLLHFIKQLKVLTYNAAYCLMELHLKKYPSVRIPVQFLLGCHLQWSSRHYQAALPQRQQVHRVRNIVLDAASWVSWCKHNFFSVLAIREMTINYSLWELDINKLSHKEQELKEIESLAHRHIFLSFYLSVVITTLFFTFF